MNNNQIQWPAKFQAIGVTVLLLVASVVLLGEARAYAGLGMGRPHQEKDDEQTSARQRSNGQQPATTSNVSRRSEDDTPESQQTKPFRLLPSATKPVKPTPGDPSLEEKPGEDPLEGSQTKPEGDDPPLWHDTAMRGAPNAFPPEPPIRPFDTHPDNLADHPEVHAYPRIYTFQNENPDSFWYSQRPNLFNVPIPNSWDFYHIIGTDRPDFTDSPFTVGKGITYLETGYTYRKITDEDGLVTARSGLPEALLRYGATKNLELRLRWSGYTIIDQHDPASGLRRTIAGGEDMAVGLKYVFMEQDNWIPMVTYVGMLYVPTGSEGLTADQTQYTQMVVTGWGLKRWLYLKNGFGVDYMKFGETSIGTNGLGAPAFIDHGDNVTDWHESISLLYQISKHVGGYSEWFCFFRDNAADNRPDHYLNTGFYIYLTPNTQLDVRVGAKVSNRNDEVFSGMGFSVRW